VEHQHDLARARDRAGRELDARHGAGGEAHRGTSEEDRELAKQGLVPHQQRPPIGDAQAAQGIDNLCVFVIDSMPGATIDPFLAKFAEQYKGQARKAGKGSDLLAAFQKMGTRTTYQYAVNYEFPQREAASAPAPAPAAPAPAPAPAPSREKTILFGAVLFDFDKAVLKPEGKEAIKTYREEARAKLTRADKIIVTGHTDNKGTAAYNKKLSLRRAQAVRDYLVSLGVDAKKIEVRGMGLTQPVADNSTEEGRAKNRRVELEVVGAGPS